MCFVVGPITVGYEKVVHHTNSGMGEVKLVIKVFSPPSSGAPRPFTLSVNTTDGTACMVLSTH